MKQYQKPSTSVVTADGTIVQGKVSIEFILTTDFVGTINGAVVTGAVVAVYSLRAFDSGCFSAISYTISAGSAILTTL